MAKQRGRPIRLSLKKIVKIEKDKKIQKEFFKKRIGFAMIMDGNKRKSIAIYNSDIVDERLHGVGLFFTSKWHYFEENVVQELSKTNYSLIVKNSDFFL